MVSCFLSTCPQSHRRPRDLVRRHWAHLVSEAMPVWAVLVDDRPAIVAPGDDRLVVVCGGMRAVDWTVGFGQIAEVSSARAVVYVVDDDGHCYDFTFLDSGDAVRAALLIDQRRTAARGAAKEAAGQSDRRAIDRWEGWRAMEPVGQDDADQIDFGRNERSGTAGGDSGAPPVGQPQPPAGDAVDGADTDRPAADHDRTERARAEADAAAIEAERAAGRSATDPPWAAAAAPSGAAEPPAAGADRPPSGPGEPVEQSGGEVPAGTGGPVEQSGGGVPAGIGGPVEQSAGEVPAGTGEPVEQSAGEVPAGIGGPVEQSAGEVSAGTGGPRPEPPAAEVATAPSTEQVGTRTEPIPVVAAGANGRSDTAAVDAPWPAAANGTHSEDEPLTAAVDFSGGGFAELPIEREVAMAIARSGGEPVEWWSIPPRGAEPPAPQQPLPIPAQASAHASESVLLVTTEGVPGRRVLEVHGDVLAVASWPAPGPAGRSVHEVARDRLAQAVLRRGGNALVGMRYGATGMVGGDVVAYGTAVTMALVDEGVEVDPRPAVGSADR